MKLDKKSAQDVEDPKTSIKKDEDGFKWRQLPSTSRECMIIASGGVPNGRSIWLYPSNATTH